MSRQPKAARPAGERGRSPERARSGTPQKAITLSPMQGDGPEEAEAPAAAAAATFTEGQLVEVEKFPKSWYVATVREVDGDQILVHYEGWSEKWDDWVKSSKAHSLTSGAEGRRRSRMTPALKTAFPHHAVDGALVASSSPSFVPTDVPPRAAATAAATLAASLGDSGSLTAT